jgi:NAD(P)H dehydrogenase (quinone)
VAHSFSSLSVCLLVITTPIDHTHHPKHRHTHTNVCAMFWNFATRWVATKLNTISTQIPPPPRADDDSEPRKVLLVHAHPLSDSFSSAIANAVEAGAREGGHELRRRSLYAEQYRPELTGNERTKYFDIADGAARLPKETRSHLADLRWCNSLVLVYPTWWFNMPAMLKGYFDRTLMPGEDCAWSFPTSDPKERTASNGLVPKLTNVKRMMGISTYGASRQITLLAGDNGRNWYTMRPRGTHVFPCADRSIAAAPTNRD